MSLAVNNRTKNYKIKTINCKHSKIFPRSILCVIAGSTGSGKTNLLVDLLKTDGRLAYNDVYIYSPTLYQLAYEHLKEYYGNMEKMLKYQTSKTVKTAQFLDANDEIVNPNALDKTKNHIMIFDDVMLKD